MIGVQGGAPIGAMPSPQQIHAGTEAPPSNVSGHPRDADFLRRLSEALAAPVDPRHVIRAACRLTGEYLGASRCYFAEIDSAAQTVTVQEDWHSAEKVSIGGTHQMSAFLPQELWAEMGRNGLAIRDVLLDDSTSPNVASFEALSVQSFAAAPFIRGGRWVAALAATDSQPRSWRQDELELLAAVAARAWPLVERAREEHERRRAEEALRVSEERLRLSYRVAGLGAWEWSMATNEVYWSPEYREIYGLDAQAPPSYKEGIAVVLEEDRPAVQDAVLEAVRSNQGYRTRHRINHPQKGLRWIEAVGGTVRNAAGAPIRMLGIVRDVTEQHNTQEELRQSEQQLRALADSIPQLAWMAEPDGNIFWYNRRWFEYTGTTLEQMQGWGWQSVHDPKILPEVLKNWKQCIETGQPFEMLFPLKSARGEFRWFLTRVNPMRGSAGQVIRWFGTNTDIHQVKRPASR